MRHNVQTIERVASVLVGTALLGFAAKRRRIFGSAAATGLGLIAVGAGGYCPVNRALGRDPSSRRHKARAGATRLRESVTIDRPAAAVFRYWRDLSHLPEFIRHLERVEEKDYGRSHWVMRGPGGTRVEWDAGLVSEVEPELLAWRSLPGADLVAAGSVRLQALSHQRTEVTVTLQYESASGAIARAIGWAAGQPGKQELGEDLRRLKAILEDGADAADDGEPPHTVWNDALIAAGWRPTGRPH